MSLFNVCNSWSTQCSDFGDNYDAASLVCTRLGVDDSEKDYLIVSSHAGHLSVFYPKFDAHNDGRQSAFKASELLLETRLKAPILGSCVGKFGSNTLNEQLNQLAILHPYSIAIYKLKYVEGVAEHGVQLRLQLIVEHRFQRFAFSFCRGHFGQVKGREFFCVSHLDGTWTFFEQDGIQYECHFDEYNPLPSVILYCERTDSFIRFRNTWTVESYTYQDLSHSSLNKSKLVPSWSFGLGEDIIDMSVIQTKRDSSSLLILGERNFFRLTDNGKLEYMMKLDYTPKCFHSFMIGYYWEATSRLITAIVSSTSKLFLYENANIIWAAQFVHKSPIAVRRSNMSGLPGSIVTLTERGELHVSYLGSEPFVFKVPSVPVEEVSLKQAHKELIQLEQEIRDATDRTDMHKINRQANENVRITFDINRSIATDADAIFFDVPADVALRELPTCHGVFKIKCTVDLAEVQVMFSMPESVRCSIEQPFMLEAIQAGYTNTYDLDFYIGELLHVPTACVDAVVSFISPKGIPRVLERKSYLPLEMFFKPAAPQKSFTIKITFSIESKDVAANLATFFPEFVPSMKDAQVLGLLLMAAGVNGHHVTVVKAKNSNRIRVQSDSLEALPLVIERLITICLDSDHKDPSTKRSKGRESLSTMVNRTTERIMAQPDIPINEILQRIDAYNEIQAQIQQQTEKMDILWDQFKELQRKLEEKSEIDSKESLIMEIEQNYDQLIAEGDKLNEIKNKEKGRRCNLICALSVAKSIVTCLRMSAATVNFVLSLLPTTVLEFPGMSWAQSVSPAIDMLYHSEELNPKKEKTNVIPDAIAPNSEFDYPRFRKHVKSVLEKIIQIASEERQWPAEKVKKEVVAGGAAAAAAGDKRQIDSGVLNEFLKLNLNAASRRRSSLKPQSTLASVESDEEESDDDKVGPRRSRDNEENAEGPEWFSENYELPSTEELFEDLGIWW